MSQVEIKILGEDGILVRFEERIDININLKVQKLKEFLLNKDIKGIKELIPSYRSLFILYDPFKISFSELKEEILKFKYKKEFFFIKRKKIFEIPAYFGSDFGVDLPYVARYHNLSEEEVIKILHNKIYYVYMYGFLPGFIYLGGLPKILHTPRLESPRVSIPKGSIGIGGEQLGIYGVRSPGGFRIVGLTYFSLIDISNDIKSFIKEGDFIRFKKISKDDFLKNYKEEIRFI
ncbi:MAG: 5-oxoprolinase subunit PxpB [Caldisericia bacterium]|jgi:KipI family sensor histidine kinase inhibitor|nr:5-oxoprolinase subunit PxpB [Caldisericia bacterium]